MTLVVDPVAQLPVGGIHGVDRMNHSHSGIEKQALVKPHIRLMEIGIAKRSSLFVNAFNGTMLFTLVEQRRSDERLVERLTRSASTDSN